MDTLTDLGLEVARLRQQRGMTQRELAQLVGMGQSTLARFETGGVSEFGSRKLMRLLEALGHELVFKPVSSSFTLDDAVAQQRLEVQKGGASS